MNPFELRYGPIPGVDPAEHWGYRRYRSNGLTAVDCFRCGYVHLAPLPTQSELDAFYDEFYERGEGMLEQDPSDRWYWKMVYQMRLNHMDKLIGDPLTEYGWHTHILDYGAGVGQFIRAALDWEGRMPSVVGYEPNPTAASEMNNIHTKLSKHMRYHVVHCSLVLEHVRDPRATLRQIHALMFPGGVLCVCVPNEFNRLQRKLARRFDYSPLHEAHVNYFTPIRLAQMVHKAGFNVIEQWGTFPMEWFALHGLNYVRHPSLGRWAHRARMTFEWAAHKAGKLVDLRRRWGLRDIGREVVLWARKADPV